MTLPPYHLPRSSLTVLASCLLLVACTSNPSLEEGRRLLAEGKPELALPKLEQATREKPEDIDARRQYFRQREVMSGRWMAEAENARRDGRLEEADARYRNVLGIDPNHRGALGGLAELGKARRNNQRIADALSAFEKKNYVAAEQLARTVLTETPGDTAARSLLAAIREADESTRPQVSGVTSPFAKPISLEFRDTPLRAALEAISRSSGLNFVLDKDVKADTKITIFLRNSTVDDALKLVLTTQQLERKLLNANSILIYPATTAKQRDYLETQMRSFYLANADVKQAATMVKQMVKTKDVFTDEKLNLLVVRDTPEAIRLIEQLIDSLDISVPEVMLEVEVLEVSRTRLLELGLQFPDQVGYGMLQNQATTTTIVNGVTQSVTTPGGSLASGYIDLHNRNSLTSFVANPGVLLNLKNQVGDSKLLANPRIRVLNREKAKIHIGEKLPVFTTTSTANVGVSASVSYLDVGLKLDVEPTVHLEEDVEIKVGLEVSSIVKEVSGPSNSLAYQVGTRSASTALRLRDGETQILAGLINDEERSSANRLPGLGDLPVLGRLFSSQRDSRSKTEIVLLITPRVVRNVVRPQVAAPALSSGPESRLGMPPMQVRSGSLKGVAAMNGGRPRASTPDEADQTAPPPGDALPTPPNQPSDNPTPQNEPTQDPLAPQPSDGSR